MQGRIHSLICVWIVYIWKNISEQTLKVPSPVQFRDCESSWRLRFVQKMEIPSASLCPLWNIRNCSLQQDRWYSRRSTGTFSLLAGFSSCWLACFCKCIPLLMWCRAGKLMAAAPDVPPSSLPNITWAGFWVSVALLLRLG